MTKHKSHLFSVAPMMDWTDRHDRFFMRLITRQALLYSEMVPTGAIVFGDRDRYLSFDPVEHPVALQIGGSDPKDLAIAAKAAGDHGYDEINLNVGCPSNRVQKGRFGACLMAEPEVVADCVGAMMGAADLPVTVKTRIGIDERDTFENLTDFVGRVADAGCRRFIIHARKAWLSGLSPKENREIPPLRYEVVHALKEHFPELEIVLNGGLESLDHAWSHLSKVDGVMMGRTAYKDPFILSQVDQRFFGDPEGPLSRQEVVKAYLPYVDGQLQRGVPLKSITRHMMGLFNGQPGARAWRRYLSEHAIGPMAGPEVLLDALKAQAEAEERQLAA